MLLAVRDPTAWRAIRLMYLGSGLIFLATVILGIANVFTPEPISHAQLMAHFHSGTVGWITLSIIATTLWVFMADRDVSAGESQFALLLATLGPLAVAGYVAAFGLFFSGNGPGWLLPLFGIPSGLAIIAGMVYAATQFKHQTVVTTPHLLLFGALLVASLGATMGILVGLSHNGWFSFPELGDGVGAHAGPMEMYLVLAFAAIVEALLVKDSVRWSKGGMAQALFGVVAAFIVSFGLFFGSEATAPIGLLLFLAGFVTYLVRIGVRALKSIQPHPGVWWGALSLPAYVVLFVVLVFGYFIPDNPVPDGLYVTFAHVSFVGMATNLVFAMHSRARGEASVWETRGIWLTNIGMLLFVAGEIFAGRNDGAIIMAAGVLLTWWQVVAKDARTVLSAPS